MGHVKTNKIEKSRKKKMVLTVDLQGESLASFPPDAVAAQFANFQNSKPGLLTAYAAAANNNTVMTLPKGGFPDADSSDTVDMANAEGVKSAFKLVGNVLIFAIVWMLIGVAAFIMSLVCLSKKGSKGGQNVIGLLLAFFLGPFYWLYYIWGDSYCTNRIAPSTGLKAPQLGRAPLRPVAGPFFSRSP
jgi:hypothetical protein